MLRRQVVSFTIGCWAAIVTAVAHLVGHVSGPAGPTDEAGRELAELATTYPIPLPDGSTRVLMDLYAGFSLTFVVFLAFVGGVGLMVRARCRDDVVMMTAVARAAAAAGSVMVAISLLYWFIVPSLMLAVMTFGFLLASVAPPGPEDGR
jgi:hypothetical protein